MQRKAVPFVDGVAQARKPITTNSDKSMIKLIGEIDRDFASCRDRASEVRLRISSEVVHLGPDCQNNHLPIIDGKFRRDGRNTSTCALIVWKHTCGRYVHTYYGRVFGQMYLGVWRPVIHRRACMQMNCDRMLGASSRLIARPGTALYPTWTKID